MLSFFVRLLGLTHVGPWPCCFTEGWCSIYVVQTIISMFKTAGGSLPWRALGRCCRLPLMWTMLWALFPWENPIHNTALQQWASAAPRASSVTQCLLSMESNNAPNFFPQDIYGLYEPRYRPYDSSASAYAENHRYSEPERPSSRASHYSDQLTPRWEHIPCGCFTLILSCVCCWL